MLFDKEEINTFCFTNGRCVFPNDFHGNYNMYSRVHIPPDHRFTKFENFLPIICRDIPNFVNFISVYVRLSRHTLSNLHNVKHLPISRTG